MAQLLHDVDGLLSASPSQCGVILSKWPSWPKPLISHLDWHITNKEQEHESDKETETDSDRNTDEFHHLNTRNSNTAAARAAAAAAPAGLSLDLFGSAQGLAASESEYRRRCVLASDSDQRRPQ